VTANKKPSRSIAGIAGIVAIATLVSKIFGLVREQIIAAAFGIGNVNIAYTYAYNLPSFLLVLIGGINGPLHTALVSVLAKKDKSEAAPIVESVTTLISILLLLLTVALICFAGTFIDIQGPELTPEVREIAILQLQIMAPLALLAGLIGIGFGTLNASDSYLLPSISPLFSSVAVVFSMTVLIWRTGGQLNTPQYMQLGAVVLAGSTLAGAIFQWLAQLIAQWRLGMGKLKLGFNWRIPGVMDIFRIMAPAILSSGMLQVNVSTDLFFASKIAGAAPAMRSANLIAITPLGIISNMILVPFLPVFSRLAAPENWQDLKVRIRQGIFLSALTMLPLTAIFISLSLPIIRLVYEYGEFDSDATKFVAPLLATYGLGLFFYLARDVLVRVFYALGDGQTPFKISVINIILNAVFDYLLVNTYGAPGLVLATISVNIISMVTFIWILHRRLNGLPLLEWSKGIFGLIIASAIAGTASWLSSKGFEQFLGSSNLLLLILELGVSSLIAMSVFTLIAMQLKLPELKMLTSRISQKLGR